MPFIVAVQMPQQCLARPLARILPVCTARPVGSLHWPAQPARSLAGHIELLAWQASKQASSLASLHCLAMMDGHLAKLPDGYLSQRGV